MQPACAAGTIHKEDMKIAILLLVHDRKEQLNRLVARLADSFDVFIHIDKKSPLALADIVGGNRVRAVKKFNVHWGSFNQVRATIELLRIAAGTDAYDRYLLISGQDVPIKTNDEIAKYFEQNQSEYIDYFKLPSPHWEGGGIDRVTRFHPRSNRGVTGLARYALRVEHSVFKLVNKMAPPRSLDQDFHGGANWFNLTGGCVKEILSYIGAHPEFMKRFKYTISADELIIQTAIRNIGYEDRVVNSSLRYIDWQSGPEFPRILREADYQKIVDSDMLFARKFDDPVDATISNRLYDLTSTDRRSA